METFSLLVEKIREIYNLRSAASVLGWDQETYMPLQGAEARADQLSVLAGLLHEKIENHYLGDLINKCIDSPELSDTRKAMIKEFKHDRDIEVKIPADLVKKLSMTTSRAFQAWAQSREKSDFSIFEPLLKEVVNLTNEKAEALKTDDNQSSYDVLLDLFEPGLKEPELTPVVDKTVLINNTALKAINSSPVKILDDNLKGSYPREKQMELSRYVMQVMGFSLSAGRLDVSAHPFTTSFSVRDVRLTTRFDENSLSNSLFSTIH